MSSTMEPQPEREIAVYEIDYYYCQLKPQNQCYQKIPGNGKTVTAFVVKDNQMQAYHNAFRDASDGAPVYPIHPDLQMMPQLINLTPPENASEIPED